MEPKVLIECVKEYNYLFDPDDKRYNDKHEREIAWNNIGKLLHFSPIECKKQWNNLRDCYRKNYKRRKEAKEGEIVKKFRYRDEMAFVLPFMKVKVKVNSGKVDKGLLSDDADDDDDEDDADRTSNTSTSEQTSNMFCSVRSKQEQETIFTDPLDLSNEVPAASPTPSVWVDAKTEPVTDSAAPITILSNEQIYPPRICQKSNGEDIDLFFNSIASTVKQLSRYNQAIAKAKVFSIISELEIGEIAEKQ